MRTSTIGRVTGCLAALTALLGARDAHAQSDTEPPLPNVMLLIDTSGSMEFMMEPDAAGKPRLPVCNPTGAGNTSVVNEQNRWTTLATVLTGEFPAFACAPQSRSDPAFKTEFAINGVAPYDADYYLPYNRMVSRQTASGVEDCVAGPDAAKWLSGSPYAYPDDSIITHRLNSTTKCASIDGKQGRLYQTDDGLLDVFREKARFGLMTFDSLPDRRTGVSGTSIDPAGGLNGNWSYFPLWAQNGNTYAQGKPELCATAQEIEVGARNSAAPPWEGRMIAFGTPAIDTTSLLARNEQVQRSILAVRPYGATPMAGLLADADHFFTADTSLDPLVTSNAPAFGPYSDPYVAGGCRKQYIILLTDGLPNLDLRDGCANNPKDAALPQQQPGLPGTCPFLTPSETARRLATLADPNRRVRTFVVGFAVSDVNGGTLKCDTLTGNNDAACVTPANDSVRACCELAKIAYNGGTGKPRFADDKPALRKALNDILSQVAENTTSRTTPVFAAAGAAGGGYSGGADKVAGYNVLSSFKVSTGGLWRGVLERQRYTCKKNGGVYSITPEDIDPSKGDSFSTNLASPSGLARQFFTVAPTGSTNQPRATWTMRRATINDGLGTIVSTPAVYGPQSSFYNAASLTDPMQLADATVKQSVCGTVKTPVAVNDCRNRILRWYTGLAPIDGSLYSREDSPLGSIYHATPTVIGPPGEFLRDESYTAFAAKFAARAPVLYAATTDGQLHAFKMGAASPTDTVKVDTAGKNELWTFVPPAILPNLKKIYPGVETRLLDIPPVVRDVVYSRDRTTAVAGGGGADLWHTVLLNGYGPALPGYFALDISDPTYDSAKATTTGPQFLWQLSNDSSGNALFGASTTPAITTVFMKDASMPDAREVAVAILPGGPSAPATTQPPGGCTRAQTALAKTVDGKWSFRPGVRCYNDADPSRSLTVVRLDTGEVIRRFHRCKAGNVPPLAYDTALTNRSTCTDFDSPLTSVPLPYPVGTGQVSTRAFVGDQDGAMWRLDMSSTNPADWKVAPFFDAFAPFPNQPNGQPILSQPVAALDAVGNLVIVFSTGEQDRFDGVAGLRNVLWSVSEQFNITSGKTESRANWHLGVGANESVKTFPAGQANGNWTDGIRVAGPLSLFEGKVFFTTYRPPAPGANACDPGSSVLWGVDYLRSDPVSTNGDAGPAVALNDAGTTELVHAKSYANALIFGVGIQRLPSCYDTSTVSDPYIGFGGSSTSVDGMTKPDYRLVVQTGAKGAQQSNAETKFESLKLQAPPSGARFSSWSSVVE
ncbi:MAG: hypothetical protein EOO75_00210 [Myxococcales bacterium]|nr:MAG: hypothetical protein EOO75_00210 [Myxococcales bacterium]